MSSPDDGVPEAIVPTSPETGEITMLPPEEAQKVAAEIRAIAEQRGEDSEVVDLVNLPELPSGPVDRLTGARFRLRHRLRQDLLALIHRLVFQLDRLVLQRCYRRARFAGRIRARIRVRNYRVGTERLIRAGNGLAGGLAGKIPVF